MDSRRPGWVRDRKSYCAQHDPEAVKARREKSAAEWRAKCDAKAEAAAHAQRISEAERKVIEAAEAWRIENDRENAMTLEAAVDALHEARKEKGNG